MSSARRLLCRVSCVVPRSKNHMEKREKAEPNCTGTEKTDEIKWNNSKTEWVVRRADLESVLAYIVCFHDEASSTQHDCTISVRSNIFAFFHRVRSFIASERFDPFRTLKRKEARHSQKARESFFQVKIIVCAVPAHCHRRQFCLFVVFSFLFFLEPRTQCSVQTKAATKQIPNGKIKFVTRRTQTV